MDDIHSAPTQGHRHTRRAEPGPTSTRPSTKSPIDQTKDVAKKVLAMITGRAKS